MTKQLYLMRHAEAVDKSHHQTDKDRELTPFGVQQSIRMGAYLSGENFLLDVIYCSTAERARQTASLSAEKIKLDPQKIIAEGALYDASVRIFFDFINKLDNGYNNVMLIGHNPALSYLAEYLTRSEIGSMSPGGTAIIRFGITSWSEVGQGNGELVYYLTPETVGKN